MSFDRLRVYDAGRFHDVDLPDWYREADRLSEKEGVNWHHAFTRALGCYPVPLTDEGCEGGWIEIRFWPSARSGNFVLIDTEAGIIEQVLVPNTIDWLPFLTQHITPLIAATAKMACSEQHRRLTRAFIAWARHGKGGHIERETGLSQIDLDRDKQRKQTLSSGMPSSEKATGGRA
jgi:hypothetical protein